MNFKILFFSMFLSVCSNILPTGITKKMYPVGVMGLRFASRDMLTPGMCTHTQLLAQPSKLTLEQKAHQLNKALKKDSPEYIYNVLQSTSRQKQLLNIRINNNIPLLAVAGSENPDIAHLFISRGARVNVSDEHGRTPLHLAAFKGYACLVEKLLHTGADVNALDNNDETALHYAIGGINSTSMQSSKLHTVAILLTHGADHSVKNKKGETPLDLNHRNNEIIADQIIQLCTRA